MIMKACAVSLWVAAAALMCVHLALAVVDTSKPDLSMFKLSAPKHDPQVELNQARTYYDLAPIVMIMSDSFSEVRGSAGFRCPSYAHLLNQFNQGFDRWSQIELENLALVTEREHALFARKYESSKPLAHHNMITAISQIEMNYLSNDTDDSETVRGNPLESWYDLIDCLKREATTARDNSNNGGNEKLVEFLSEPERAARIVQYEKDNLSEDERESEHNNNAARLVCPTEARPVGKHVISTNEESEMPKPGMVMALIKHWEEGRPWIEGVQVTPQVSVESVFADTQHVNIITLVSRFESMAMGDKDREDRKAYLYKLGLDHYLSLDHIKSQLEAEKEEQRKAEAESGQLEPVDTELAEEVSQRLKKQIVNRGIQQTQAEWATNEARAKAAHERARHAKQRVVHLKRVIEERQAAEKKRGENEKQQQAGNQKPVSRINFSKFKHLERKVSKSAPSKIKLQRLVDEWSVSQTILYIADRFKKFDTADNTVSINPISFNKLRNWAEAWSQLKKWDAERNHVAMSLAMLFLYSNRQRQILNARINTNMRSIAKIKQHFAALDAASQKKGKQSLSELRAKLEDIRALLSCVDTAVDTSKLQRKLKQWERRPKEWATMAQFIDDGGHWAKSS